MKFTLVFPSHESADLSFGLLFLPSPAWTWGAETLINLNPADPRYQPGSVRRLLEHGSLRGLLDETDPVVTVLVHPSGNGTEADLETLRADLTAEGFQPRVIA